MAVISPQSKEKAQHHSLTIDWYDYGARFYDTALGRFQTLDSRAEIYNFQSPLSHVANNPALYMDYNGEGQLNYLKGAGLIIEGS